MFHVRHAPLERRVFGGPLSGVASVKMSTRKGAVQSGGIKNIYILKFGQFKNRRFRPFSLSVIPIDFLLTRTVYSKKSSTVRMSNALASV